MTWTKLYGMTDRRTTSKKRPTNNDENAYFQQHRRRCEPPTTAFQYQEHPEHLLVGRKALLELVTYLYERCQMVENDVESGLTGMLCPGLEYRDRCCIELRF